MILIDGKNREFENDETMESNLILLSVILIVAFFVMLWVTILLVWVFVNYKPFKTKPQERKGSTFTESFTGSTENII